MSQENNNVHDIHENGTDQISDKMTKKEFNKNEKVKPLISQIRAVAITAYILILINVVVMVVTSQYGLIVDILIILGLSLGIHLVKSRVCAIILLVYSLGNIIYISISREQLAGYWIALVAIGAVSATFKYGKAWKEYTVSGKLPEKK